MRNLAMLRKASLALAVFAFLFMISMCLFISFAEKVHMIKAKKVSNGVQGVAENMNAIKRINSGGASLKIKSESDYYFQKEEEKNMKVIGLLGGMSWHSSVEYYRIINQIIVEKLGGYHSAHLILYSVDFAPIERAQHEGRWDDAAKILTEAAIALKRAGADFVIICANTMHKVADDVEKDSGLPLLHIADVTGKAIIKQGLGKVGLLGTKFTMEEEFYRARLKERFGLEVIIPDEKDRKTVNRIIYQELGRGIYKESSRNAYVEVIHRLMKRGAEGIILGCTEIPLLIRPGDIDIPLFDTTRIHAKAAVDLALSER